MKVYRTPLYFENKSVYSVLWNQYHCLSGWVDSTFLRFLIHFRFVFIVSMLTKLSFACIELE